MHTALVSEQFGGPLGVAGEQMLKAGVALWGLWEGRFRDPAVTGVTQVCGGRACAGGRAEAAHVWCEAL